MNEMGNKYYLSIDKRKEVIYKRKILSRYKIKFVNNLYDATTLLVITARFDPSQKQLETMKLAKQAGIAIREIEEKFIDYDNYELKPND